MAEYMDVKCRRKETQYLLNSMFSTIERCQNKWKDILNSRSAYRTHCFLTYLLDTIIGLMWIPSDVWKGWMKLSAKLCSCHLAALSKNTKAFLFWWESSATLHPNAAQVPNPETILSWSTCFPTANSLLFPNVCVCVSVCVHECRFECVCAMCLFKISRKTALLRRVKSF